MSQNSVFLSRPQMIDPQHSAPQAQLLAFLQEVHSKGEDGDANMIGRLIRRYGVKETQIASRRFECPDVYLPPEERRIYRKESRTDTGSSIYDRGQFFSQRAKEILSSFYPPTAPAPDHLIHVTCTGYISPSAAQHLVSKNGWATEITHAYHMGCYASLPAIRLAMGQCLGLGKSVDVVHTEICSLHMNPADHSPEQLIVQSLFADGHARYSISSRPIGPGFRVLTTHERLLPDSAGDMVWMPAPWGMQMILSREVPGKINPAIRAFLLELLAKAGLSLDDALKRATFAIHPGGPKIIDSIKESLELSEEQVAPSRKVLLERGNMSSATLPHVWEEIARLSLPRDHPVISLAFGPGLTVFGGVFLWAP